MFIIQLDLYGRSGPIIQAGPNYSYYFWALSILKKNIWHEDPNLYNSIFFHDYNPKEYK